MKGVSADLNSAARAPPVSVLLVFFDIYNFFMIMGMKAAEDVLQRAFSAFFILVTRGESFHATIKLKGDMNMQYYPYMQIDNLIPYVNNPRLNDDAVEVVAASIREFGFKNPIIVDQNNVIIAGHTRLKAAKKLGLEGVPVIVVDDLSEEQVRAFRLADNKTGEAAEWDMEKLAEELGLIPDIDMESFGFYIPDDDDYEEEDDENIYSQKTNIPQYEPTGEMPELDELVDPDKTNELIAEIDRSGLSYGEKEFLKKAAQRHLAFNYKKIAEYYANASAEMQNLMEKSALVIIDYNDAIAYGYTKLSETVRKLKEASEKAMADREKEKKNA